MSRERRDGWACGVLAAVIAAAFIFPLLGKSGVWDPYELDRADLARRVAIEAFGARDLPGGAATLPTLTDLGGGELATTSMALAFKLFGLHDWSGRLAMAVWAMAAVMAMYVLLARLVAPRAGLYAAIALSTMPIFFVQARTMLGEMVPMAACAIATAGLAGALLDRGRLARGLWLAVGVLGLASGLNSRGLILGVAPVALAVAIGFALTRSLGERRHGADRLAIAYGVVGALALLVGVGALFEQLSLRAYREVALSAFQAAGHFPTEPFEVAPPVSRWLGVSLLSEHPAEATFDRYVRQIGHALFPWSALLPFALGRLLVSPPPEAGQRRASDASLRIMLVLGIGLAWAASTLLVPFCEVVAYAGAPLMAAAIGVAIFDGERGAPPSRAAALVTLILVAVLYVDFAREPAKAYAAFAVEGAEFPASFEERGAHLMRIAAIAFGLVTALTLFEGDRPPEGGGLVAWVRRRWTAYLDVVEELSTVWKGNLLFAFVVVEAALIGLAAMIFLGGRFGWAPVEKLPRNLAAYGYNLWWAVPIVLAIIVPAWVAMRDLFRVLVRFSRAPRARGMALAGLLAGALLGFDYYPVLGAQLSPKEVFSSHAALAKPGEHLALLGVNPRAAAYYEGAAAYVFPEPRTAGQWLAESAPARRWLVVTADNLPDVNAIYRRVHRKNAPVMDGRSSQVVLLSSELDGAVSQSWLDAMVLDEAPVPARALETRFQDELEVLGWEIRDEEGRLVDAVVPGKPYRMRFYYRVLAEIRGQWKAFVHIDGHSRRYNADHTALEGRYPMSLWLPGDFILDDVELRLEPNFTPGDYHLFFGFYRGAARMKVSEGAEREDRAYGGVVRVL